MKSRSLILALTTLPLLLATGCGGGWLSSLRPDQIPTLPEGQATSWRRIQAEARACRESYVGHPFESMLVQGGNGPFYNTTREGGPETRSYYFYRSYYFPPLWGYVELKMVEYRLTLDDEGIVRQCDAHVSNLRQYILDGSITKDQNFVPPAAHDVGPWGYQLAPEPQEIPPEHAETPQETTPSS